MLSGADDKAAAGVPEFWQVGFVFSQGVEFYGDVVSYVGELAVKSFNELKGVANAIEEVRIAERNVLRTHGHLLANVLHHDVAVHDAKDALVNRDDRTMAAAMFAAAAGLGRADEAESAAWKDEVSVFFNGRHIRSVRDIQGLSGKIEADDFMAALAQPGRRRREAKWLPSQFVGRNQNDVHVLNSIAGCPPQGIVFGYHRSSLAPPKGL